MWRNRPSEVMYSLYRAWLMRDPVTAASWTTPPDLIITVGNLGVNICEETMGYGYQFAAHKQLVSMHSGYLKSLIHNNESSTSCGMSITNISLPNISSETFAPLLSYMYTGYLDLTNDNIYSVLLATHLLHMPRALDICRAFLIRNQSGFQNSSTDTSHSLLLAPQSKPNLVKPIPSRKIKHFEQSVWPSIGKPPVVLHTRPDGPFKCIFSTDGRKATLDSFATTELKSPVAVPSTSKTCEVSPELSVAPSTFSNESLATDDRTANTVKSFNRKKIHRKRENSAKMAKKINNENLKVEFDVASCDGPVRFHRVLNESYNVDFKKVEYDADFTQINTELEKISEKEYLENYPKTQFLKLKSSNFTNFMHQQMMGSNSFKKPKTAKGIIKVKNIMKKNKTSETAHLKVEKESHKRMDNSDRTFTCVYCKHTFKSQYCYQKHARRHINAIREDNDNEKDRKGKAEGTQILRQVSPEFNNRADEPKENFCREVRLFDMNVQYYPCKTCGSKFPSYYFVHKHRKLCHGNEDNSSEGNGDRGSETADSLSSEKAPEPETLFNC